MENLVRQLVLVALFALVAASAGTATAAAPERPEAREPKLQRALDDLVAAGIPGAVLLVRDG